MMFMNKVKAVFAVVETEFAISERVARIVESVYDKARGFHGDLFEVSPGVKVLFHEMRGGTNVGTALVACGGAFAYIMGLSPEIDTELATFGLKDGESVAVMTSVPKVNGNKRKRLEAVLAHELGHLYLNHAKEVLGKTKEEVLSIISNPYHPREYEADAFAALVMGRPDEMIKFLEFVKLHVSKSFKDIGSREKIKSGGFNPFPGIFSINMRLGALKNLDKIF